MIYLIESYRKRIGENNNPFNGETLIFSCIASSEEAAIEKADDYWMRHVYTKPDHRFDHYVRASDESKAGYCIFT